MNDFHTRVARQDASDPSCRESAALAIALHQQFGHELGLARSNSDVAGGGSLRAFVYLNRDAGWIADAHGVRLIEELLMDLGDDPFAPERCSVSHRPASEADIREAFGREMVSEAAIRHALHTLPSEYI